MGLGLRYLPWCHDILDSGSQVAILFKSFYEEHLRHLLLRPLKGLGLYGPSQNPYPYQGYVRIQINFPAQVVGIDHEITTVALVCPDTVGAKGTALIVGMNSSLFQVLGQYCQWQAGP